MCPVSDHFEATELSVLRELEAQRLDLELRLSQEELLQLCRDDVNAFATYVFGVRQGAFHRKLQALCDQHQYLCIDAPVEHGKSTAVSVIRALWILGNNPYETIALIGNATENPERFLGVIRMMIADSERLHAVFPGLKMTESTKSSVTVERPGSTDKDPSIVALGVQGSIIGRRWSLLILDDYIDFANSWTSGERAKTKKILESTILNRVVKMGRIIDIGTPWNLDDSRHWMRKLPGFKFFRFDASDNLWPETWTDPVTGKQYGWTKERLKAKRAQMSGMEWDRQYRCIAASSSMRVFPAESMEKCKELGRGLKLGRPAPDGAIVVTGVDVAIKKSESADTTVFFTIAIKDGKKELLDIRTGRWELSEIMKQALAVVRQYPQHAGMRVETNAAQDWLRQALDNPEIMKTLGATESDLQRLWVRPHQTTQRKYDPVTGIRGMEVDFEQGRFIIPCDDNLVCEESTQMWIDGLMAFDITGHTPDDVMASWLAVEESRRFFASGGDLWSSFGLM